MSDGSGPRGGARVKAALIDPESLAVLWSNEPSAPTLALDDVVPMAETLNVRDALRVAADTGEPQHLRADLVSTGKGSMSLVVSVYRLPDGMLLVLSEHTWLAASGPAPGSGSHRSPRRARG